jgi:hypothetical protein
MLRLNPNDNQGVRYTLAGFLLALGRDDVLARLLDHYPDEGSAAWAYTKALLAFRCGGHTAEARRLLEEAKEANRHVPDYVLDRKFPPRERPGSYSPGDDSEALHYIGSCLVRPPHRRRRARVGDPGAPGRGGGVRQTAYVLDVLVPYQEHVLPMIPSGMTVKDIIKA